MKKPLSHLFSILLVVLASIFTPISLYFSNIGSIKFYEIAIFSGIFSSIGLIVHFILLLFTKSEYKSAISASIFIVLFSNLGRLTTFISYKYLCVIFILLSAISIFLTVKFLNIDIAKLFTHIMSIVLVAIYLFNFFIAIPRITATNKADEDLKKDISTQYEYINSYKGTSTNSASNPNVYFIILDEYAGFNAINNLYGYENSEFYNYLIDNKFSVATNSTNYMDGTYECLANVLTWRFPKKTNILKPVNFTVRRKSKTVVFYNWLPI